MFIELFRYVSSKRVTRFLLQICKEVHGWREALYRISPINFKALSSTFWSLKRLTDKQKYRNIDGYKLFIYNKVT